MSDTIANNETVFTLSELRTFMINISNKYNICKKELVSLLQNQLNGECENNNMTDISIKSDIINTEIIVSTCVAIKKDKTVCGRKVKDGETKCSIHKSRSTTKKNESIEVSDNTDDLINSMNNLTVNPDINTVQTLNLSIHPRLGLYWDQKNTRFVFYKKDTNEMIVIAKYTHTLVMIDDSDIIKCNNMKLKYVVTNLLDIIPQFPDKITIEGEFERVKTKCLLESESNNTTTSNSEETNVTKSEQVIPIVKNIIKDTKMFPRKNIQNMDIIDTINEVTVEPELEDELFN